MRAAIDHLVYATLDLDRGIREIHDLIGITPAMGGQHPGRGTRNALLALGDDVYLEIVAPDPAQPAPANARWLGVDTISRSRLTTWVAKANDLTSLQQRAIASGVPLGAVKSAERRRADGTLLSWQLTEPEPLIANGVIPFFIDWGMSIHPALSAPRGALLREFRIEHPNVGDVQRMLRVLDLDVPVMRAETPSLVAVIDGARGRVELR